MFLVNKMLAVAEYIRIGSRWRTFVWRTGSSWGYTNGLAQGEQLQVQILSASIILNRYLKIKYGAVMVSTWIEFKKLHTVVSQEATLKLDYKIIQEQELDLAA